MDLASAKNMPERSSPSFVFSLSRSKKGVETRLGQRNTRKMSILITKKKKIRINFPDNFKVVKYFPEVFR